MQPGKGLTVLILLAATASVFAQNAGPLDNYYLTAGVNTDNIIINGSTATLFTQAFGTDEYAIAVSGDVRTAGDGQNPTNTGGLYNLGFTYLGTSYDNFPYDPTQTNLFYDGTTDGSHNYVVSYGSSAEVYSTNQDWTNLTPMFSVGSSSYLNLGITYDPFNNSLWVSGWNNTLITDYSMTGAVLSSFSSGLDDMTALAFDPGDGTLWFGGYTTGTFYQYSTAGAFLQSVTYGNLSGVNILGGEFNETPSTPEPISTVGFGLGAVALLRRRRKS